MASGEEILEIGGAFDKVFDELKKHFDEERLLRDELREIIRSIEECGREMLVVLMKTHGSAFTKDGAELVKIHTSLNEVVKPLFKKLAEKIEPNTYYKYHDQFRFMVQRIVHIISFAHFLEHGTLIDRDGVANMLEVEVDGTKGFHLDLEDYLSGLLFLTNDLARYAFNAVTAGNNGAAFKIEEFVGSIDSKFRLLNLKNDQLRKRFDSLKYDVQKCEQIVYDLTIRGLKPVSKDSESTGDDHPIESTTKAFEKTSEPTSRDSPLNIS